ncbi:TetR/AcrR family transcriptional regulator [Streptomyces sp. NPDC049879]|uniref:TetR/AcrR family transcriptional regulator n=1 Tax=Streptomyces sp. NPDC049879 TaxID=3365598 RepID=UPI0037957029
MAKSSGRMSAEERRESVIRAAVTEFARGGYAGTSTAAIAQRVGVSQPYLFRLFPDKRAIFLAAAERCTGDILRAFEAAVGEAPESAAPGEVEHLMGEAYNQLIADQDVVMFQMQMYVAVHTAQAAGDTAFGTEVRTHWRGLWDAVHLWLGADAERTGRFFGDGMLINTLLSLGFTAEDQIWGACGEALDRQALPGAG